MSYELSFILSVLFCFSVFVCAFSTEGIIFRGDPDKFPGAISTGVHINTSKTHGFRIICWASFSAWYSQSTLVTRIQFPLPDAAQSWGTVSLEDSFFTHGVGLLAHFQRLSWICRCSASFVMLSGFSWFCTGSPVLIPVVLTFSWARFWPWMAMKIPDIETCNVSWLFVVVLLCFSHVEISFFTFEVCYILNI